MDMSNVSQENDGVHFVLVAIDIFSRYTLLEPLKTKQGQAVLNAFSKIFAQGRQPNKMTSDKGTEFTGKLLRKYLEDLAVGHFVTQNQVKANYAERVIKTIKGRYTGTSQRNNPTDTLIIYTTLFAVTTTHITGP